ncbi:MAG: AAA family ATPase [Candidatus Latescibacterota bacterium]
MDPRAEKTGFDPEQLRRLLARQLQDARAAAPEPAGAGEEATGRPPHAGPRFDLKPEELEEYLDRYVIKQHEAKAILSTKICTHFNRLNLPPDEDEDIVGGIKNNVLMIGPTGVGKTFLIRLIARRLGVPFVKGDATKFSETGYVGGDVEDLVRELVREADGDVERAQCGIIYIDEIDKIAAARGVVGPDVSRTGVQRNLLKLMEETEVDLKPPHDIASQMETVMQMQRTGRLERKRVNTRNILFIVSGAFAGLEEIIARRLNQGAIGFRLRRDEASGTGEVQASELLRQVRADDLIEYGFESEFVGRLPVVAVLHELGRAELLEILRNPRSSIILAKKRDFGAYGIDVEFTDGALAALADLACEEHIGARGLVSAMEKVLLRFEKKLPSLDVRHFVVNEETVCDPEGSLRLLWDTASLREFTDGVQRDHGVRLSFTPEAALAVRQLAQEGNATPAEVCRRLFADYAHGLRLAGREELVLTPQVVQAPQEALSALIREFHRSRGQDQQGQGE